jgi:O-antigen/teichoic acid export membrane protein
MIQSTLRPSVVDPVAGGPSRGAKKPRQHGLRARIHALPEVSPVVWLTSGRVTQQALSLILFAVLAPVLGPRPYGLFALVMVFVGFCEAILLDGAVEALVTVDDLDHLHTTAANLTNGVMALLFGLVMFALAPAIAAALHDAELRNVMWALAPMPVLSTLSAAPIAVLRRSLKFKQLAIRSILGLTIGGVFGIALAVAGAGVWALVMQVLTQRIAELVIGWIAVPVRFGLTWSAPHFHELRPVALNVFGARIMAMVNGQLPRLVLGFMLGPTDVGLFALGSRFHDIIIDTTALPRTQVGRIELRAAKMGSVEFQRDLTKMVQNASVLAFPFFLGTAALAPSLFHLWLKQQWQVGIVPTQLIVLGGLPMVLFSSFDVALLAANLSSVVRRIATLQCVTVAATVLCAAPFGLTAACLALAVRSWLLLPVVFLIFRRATNISGRSALVPAVRPLIGAVIMAGLLSLPFPQPTWMNAALLFALQVIAGIAFYFSYLYFFARGDLRPFLSGFKSRDAATKLSPSSHLRSHSEP